MLIYMTHTKNISFIDVMKEMMARFNLNYHPGYDIRELENQPLVENPDIALTRKAIQLLGKEAKEQEQEILSIEARLSRRQDKRLVKKLEGLRLESQAKNNDLAQFQEKLRSLPDKVPITELLRGRPLSRSDLEEKKLYDLMRFICFTGALPCRPVPTTLPRMPRSRSVF